MAVGKCREAWDHTASLLMLLANVNRPRGGRRYHLSDFHPYLERAPRGVPITADNIGLLIEAFVAPERRLACPAPSTSS